MASNKKGRRKLRTKTKYEQHGVYKFHRAGENWRDEFGSFGAASEVRRIDPKEWKGLGDGKSRL